MVHDSIGANRIERRIVQLAQHLKEGIDALGLDLVTPMNPELSFGVCITRTQPGQGSSVSNRMYAEHGIAGAATGGLRLCPTIYNTVEHIDRAVAGIKAIMT
jgi:isopenicillin-N epimerase